MGKKGRRRSRDNRSLLMEVERKRGFKATVENKPKKGKREGGRGVPAMLVGGGAR